MKIISAIKKSLSVLNDFINTYRYNAIYASEDKIIYLKKIIHLMMS